MQGRFRVTLKEFRQTLNSCQSDRSQRCTSHSRSGLKTSMRVLFFARPAGARSNRSRGEEITMPAVSITDGGCTCIPALVLRRSRNASKPSWPVQAASVCASGGVQGPSGSGQAAAVRICFGAMPKRLRKASEKCEGVLKPQSRAIWEIDTSVVCRRLRPCSSRVCRRVLAKP